MNKFYTAIGLGFISFQAYAHQLEVSVEALDGTYVGESTYYYDTEYSDLPGFYHEENSLEHGIHVKYIHELEDWDIFAKYGLGTSELRNSRTSEAGARYRLDEKHWFSARIKGQYAKEEYEIDDKVIDPEHQNTITNGEWAEWVILSYRYNMPNVLSFPMYIEAEGVVADNDPELMQDKLSIAVGFSHGKYFGELKAGEDLIGLSIGMQFDLSD